MIIDASLSVSNQIDYMGFCKYDPKFIKSKNIIKSNVLFNLYDAEIQYHQDKTLESIFIVEFKFIQISHSELEKIIDDMNEIILLNDISLNQNFLIKLGFMYQEDERIFAMLYKKNQTEVLDIEKFIKERNGKGASIDENFVKLEILKKLIDISISMSTTNHSQKFNKLHFGVLHPDLLFYSKEFIYFDFAFSVILSHCERNLVQHSIPLVNFFGFFSVVATDSEWQLSVNDIAQEKIKESLDVELVIILMTYFMKNQFAYDHKGIISYDNILSKFQQDFSLCDSFFEKVTSILEHDEKLQDFIQGNMAIELTDIPSLQSFNEAYLRYYLESYDEKSQCSICKKIEDDAPQKATKGKLFNGLCFEVLCEKCAVNHNCKFIKDIRESTMFKEYDAFHEDLEKVRFTKCAIPKIASKDLVSFYNENMDQFRQHWMKETNINYGAIKRKEAQLKNLIHLIIDGIDLKLKHEISSVQKEIQIVQDLIKNSPSNHIDSLHSLRCRINQLSKMIREAQIIRNSVRIEATVSILYENKQSYLNQFKNLERFQREATELFERLLEYAKETPNVKFITDIRNPCVEYPEFIQKEFVKPGYHQFIAAFNLDRTEIHLLDTKNRKHKIIKTHKVYYTKGCRTANMKTMLVITGGKVKNANSKEEYIKKCFYMKYFKEDNGDEDFRAFGELPDMIYGHSGHSIAANDYLLFCVGGRNTVTCEYFNFFSNKWTEMASLKKPILNASLYLHDNIDLYLFFGTNNNDQLSNEILQLQDPVKYLNSEWKSIHYSNPDPFKPRNFFTIIPLGNKILIMGGTIKTDPEPFTETFIYHIDKQTLKLDRRNEDFKKKIQEKEILEFYESQFYQTDQFQFQIWTKPPLRVIRHSIHTG